MARLKDSLLIFLISLLLLVVPVSQSLLFAQDDISVRRDDDKTVYTIDGEDENKQLQEKERDKAWDMLKNMPVIIDGRRSTPVPGQPAQPGPAQPAPGK